VSGGILMEGRGRGREELQLHTFLVQKRWEWGEGILIKCMFEERF
jgi:hypothetical protein